MRGIVLPAALLALGLPGLQVGRRAQVTQGSVFHSGTDMVVVEVSVQRRNAVITGLAATDFDLRDNGVRQSVAVDDAASVPVDVSLVFDTDIFAQRTIKSHFSTDLSRIAALLRSTDRLQVITYAREVREALALQHPKAPREAGRNGSWSMSPEELDQLMRERDDNDPPSQTASAFDALFFALAQPTEVGRRHLVIFFGTGQDSGSVLDDGQILTTIASRSDACVHMALWNRRNSDTRGVAMEGGLLTRYGVASLTEAARVTGGDAHDAADAVGAFKTIFADFQRAYVLRYTLTGVPKPGWHAISVTVPNHPEYAVRARQGYMGVERPAASEGPAWRH